MRKILLSLISFCCSNFIYAQSIVLDPGTVSNLYGPSESFIVNSKSYEPLVIKNDKPYFYIPFYAQSTIEQGAIFGQDESFRLWGRKGLDFFVDDYQVVSFRGDNMLIGEYGTAIATVDVAGANGVGTIRSKELDFAETVATERRQVYADKDGILRVENSSNHYASYNFTSVFPQNSADSYTKGSGYAWFNTTDAQKTFYLPVNLPDGVKITNVRMYLKDNSNSNLSLTFYRNEHLSNDFVTLASAQSSTNNANLLSINSNLSATVDNQNNSYYVNITSSGNWTGNSLQFHSLLITYQYQ